MFKIGPKMLKIRQFDPKISKEYVSYCKIHLRTMSTTIISLIYQKIYKSNKMINLINKSINYSYVLKQEAELFIPAQTGNRSIKMYRSI